MSKLALGTAQFGMDYGINNQGGKVSQKEVFKILRFAFKNGVEVVDTAAGYGESEAVLGYFFSKHGSKKVKVISKLPGTPSDSLMVIAADSLVKLGIPGFYAYLLHNFSSFEKNRGIWREMEQLKRDNLTQKIGFSCYFPEEVEKIMDEGIRFDIVQLPYNLFDRRFEKVFEKLKKKKIEIHLRSAFLQGLLVKEASAVDPYFNEVKDKLSLLWSFSLEHQIPAAALCLNFVLLNEFADRVVVGVDSLKHLKELVGFQEHFNAVKRLIPKLEALRVDNEDILLPFRWKLTGTGIEVK